MSDLRSDRGAELALLAACMESKTAREEARRHITSADFDDPRHESIFDAMTRLDRHGKAIDATTLNTMLAGKPAQPVLDDDPVLAQQGNHVGHGRDRRHFQERVDKGADFFFGPAEGSEQGSRQLKRNARTA